MQTINFSIVALMVVSMLIPPIFTLESTHATSVSEEWQTTYTVGHFLNSDPPIPDKVFKVQYRVLNGTIESFNIQNTVAVSVSGNGVLEIKYPRNYPYTNSANGEGERVLFVNGLEEEFEKETTDCFYVYSIPFTDGDEIELVSTYTLNESPHHGDDVPESCIPETIVEDVPVRNDGTITPLHQFRAGVAVNDIWCNEEYELIIAPNNKPYCATPSSAGILRDWWNIQ